MIMKQKSLPMHKSHMKTAGICGTENRKHAWRFLFMILYAT